MPLHWHLWSTAGASVIDALGVRVSVENLDLQAELDLAYPEYEDLTCQLSI